MDFAHAIIFSTQTHGYEWHNRHIPCVHNNFHSKFLLHPESTNAYHLFTDAVY